MGKAILERRPVCHVRIFLATSIPRFEGIEDLFEAISKIPYSKPVRTPELHLTFRFFGNVSPAYVEQLKGSLEEAQLRKFAIKVKGIGAFPSLVKANVLFLEVENSPTITENASLVAQIKPISFEKRPFVPHITVGRFNKPADCTSLKKKFGSISFEKEISEIIIYESTLSEMGPIYNRLKAFQLK